MTHFIIIATPVYIAIFWALVFITENIFRNKAKFMLSVFMVTTALLFTCHAVFFLKLHDIYLALDAIYLFTSLSVYPLYYWYIRLLTLDTKLEIHNLLHFIPAVVLSVSLEFFHIIGSPEEEMLYLNGVLIDNNWQFITMEGNVGRLAGIFFVSRIIFAIQVIYCMVLGYRLASKHNERIGDYYSNLENRKLVWIKLLTVSFLVFSMSSSVFNFLGRGMFLESSATLLIPAGLFSGLLFLVGLLGNKQRDTNREMENEADENIHSEALSLKSQLILKERLNALMINDHMFLIPDLKITNLCKILNTNRTYLSNVINEETNGNFNTYVNRFRIEYAINLMKSRGGSLLILDYIAQESGFGSSSSFNRAFKAIKGTTPGKYMQEMQNQQQEMA